MGITFCIFEIQILNNQKNPVYRGAMRRAHGIDQKD